MARGKHATALFEVIHNARLQDKTEKGGALKTPKWWFKGRPSSTQAPAAPPATAAPAPMRSNQGASASAPPTIIIFDDAESAADPTLGATARSLSHVSAAAPPQLGAGVAMDSDQQQITVRVSYTSALIGAFAVVVVVALAYTIGSHMRRGPSSALGQSIEQLRSGRPSPAALKVNQGQDKSAAPAQTEAQARSAPVAPANQTPADANPAAPANGKRIVGMQYVVVQSYPEEADAKAAVEALAKSGVGATIQQGFWPARPKWFSVIGTREFDRLRNNPDFDRYLNGINALSARFADNSKFKRFEPMPVKWKDTN